jgi:hypothetical protein
MAYDKSATLQYTSFILHVLSTSSIFPTKMRNETSPTESNTSKKWPKAGSALVEPSQSSVFYPKNGTSSSLPTPQKFSPEQTPNTAPGASKVPELPLKKQNQCLRKNHPSNLPYNPPSKSTIPCCTPHQVLSYLREDRAQIKHSHLKMRRSLGGIVCTILLIHHNPRQQDRMYRDKVSILTLLLQAAHRVRCLEVWISL